MRGLIVIVAMIGVTAIAGCQQVNTPASKSERDEISQDQRLKNVMDRQSPDYRERVRKGELSGY